MIMELPKHVFRTLSSQFFREKALRITYRLTQFLKMGHWVQVQTLVFQTKRYPHVQTVVFQTPHF